MWTVFEFLDERSRSVIESWLKAERIQKKARILLVQKIDLLRQYGPELPPGLLSTGPIDGGHIYKLKVRGPVMLRPLLCKGPFSNDTEYTFLQGAIERNRILPESDIVRAETNRKTLISNPNRRQIYDGKRDCK